MSDTVDTAGGGPAGDSTVAPASGLDAAFEQALAETGTADTAQTDGQTDGQTGGMTGPAEPAGDTAAAPPSAQYWSEAQRAAFAALPAEARRFVVDRENQFGAAMRQVGRQVETLHQQYGAFDRTLAPYRQAIEASGQHPAQYIGALLGLAAEADRDFAGFVREQARLRGIDPADLAGGGPAASDLDGASAQPFARLEAENRALREQIQQVAGFIQSRQQLEAQQAERAMAGSITEFRRTAPHFGAVRERMAALLESGQANDLHDAYDMAVWADPHTRHLMLEARQAESRNRAETERRRQLADARRASRIPGTGTLPGGSARGHGVEAAVEAAMRDAGF